MGLPRRFLDASYDVDVVFMDIDLPGMNGMDAAAQMLRCDATTQIVFVTSLAQYAVKGYEVDAAGFIVKPVRFYDMAMCLDKVRRVISRNVGKTSPFVRNRGCTSSPSRTSSTLRQAVTTSCTTSPLAPPQFAFETASGAWRRASRTSRSYASPRASLST